MGKIEIKREDVEEFRKTRNGKQKYLWLKIGIVIDLLSTLSVSILNIYASRLRSLTEYLIILYILLVIVVIGGEFIGTYFGALEQYVIDKTLNKKKEIDYYD